MRLGLAILGLVRLFTELARLAGLVVCKELPKDKHLFHHFAVWTDIYWPVLGFLHTGLMLAS